MNPTTPPPSSSSAVATGALVVTGSMMAGLIIYLFSLTRVPPPSVEVAGTLAAILMAAGHGFGKAFMWFVNRRWPPKEPAK